MVLNVDESDWSTAETRKQVLKEAREQARTGRTRVFIKVKGKRGKTTMATVDGRFYRGM